VNEIKTQGGDKARRSCTFIPAKRGRRPLLFVAYNRYSAMMRPSSAYPSLRPCVADPNGKHIRKYISHLVPRAVANARGEGEKSVLAGSANASTQASGNVTISFLKSAACPRIYDAAGIDRR